MKSFSTKPVPTRPFLAVSSLVALTAFLGFTVHSGGIALWAQDTPAAAPGAPAAETPPASVDGWHPSARRGQFEHWYFDARLDGDGVRFAAEDSTLVSADVNARKRYGSHASTPVMLARDGRVVLSTGEVEVETGPDVFNDTADHAYRSRLTLRSGSELELVLEVKEMLHEMVALR